MEEIRDKISAVIDRYRDVNLEPSGVGELSAIMRDLTALSWDVNVELASLQSEWDLALLNAREHEADTMTEAKAMANEAVKDYAKADRYQETIQQALWIMSRQLQQITAELNKLGL